MQIVNTKVKFIISEVHICQGYRQAYMVGDSKNSYDSAVSWAKGYYSKDFDPYEEYETDNKDFQLFILESAKGSSQGGKLSFWNCLVRKDDKEFAIGIKAESLCELLKKTTWINGVCQDGISFYRNNQVEILRTCDIEQTTDTMSKKTTKWEIGKTYGTKKTEDICIGEVYTPVITNYIENSYKCVIDFNKKSKAYYNPTAQYLFVNFVKSYPSRYELQVPQISVDDVYKMVNDAIEKDIDRTIRQDYPYYDILFSFDGIPRYIDKLIEYYNKTLEEFRNRLNNKSKLYHSLSDYIVKVVTDNKQVETFIYDNSLEYEIKILETIIPWLEGLKND